MTWIIQSKNWNTGRSGEDRYQTEDGFRVALTDLFNDIKKQFVSATLPDGKVLDEAAARALVRFTIGESAIGEASLL
jgi:hypothetical protein